MERKRIGGITRNKEKEFEELKELEKCPVCEGNGKILFESGFDTEAGIFTTIDIDIQDGDLITNFFASYGCEEVQENGELEEVEVETERHKRISINYCPVCGKLLKHNKSCGVVENE